MATTYTLIASNTLTVGTSAVSFTSIPAIYTDLLIRASIRDGYVGGGNPNAFQTSFMRFNADTANNYSRTYLWGTGSAAASGTAGSLSSVYLQFSNSDNSTNNTFSSVEIYIPNYLSSEIKPVSLTNIQENNNTAAYITATAALWNVTSSISALSITNGAGELNAGSSFYLYGIKNS